METQEQTLKLLLEQQKNTTLALEEEFDKLNQNDIVQENKKLLMDVQQLQEQKDVLSAQLKQVMEERQTYKDSLYQQVFDDKKRILKHSKEQTDLLFKKEIGLQMNQLQELEVLMEGKIKQLSEIVAQENETLKNHYANQLAQLQSAVQSDIISARAHTAQQEYELYRHNDVDYDNVANKPLTEAQVAQMAKKNNIEQFVGLKLINKIGLFLIIIGVIAISRFGFFRLTDTLKSICIFLLGGAMLGAGEFINRKKATVFSVGLTAAGVSILYVGLGVSFFGFQILSFLPALLLCILITAVAFFLSVRYHSQTISIFALIGGYLPLLVMSSSPVFFMSKMAYFLLLNIFILLLSFKNKWMCTSFVGLVLHVIASFALIFQSIDAFEGSSIALISYILISFVVYNLVPLVSTYKKQSEFQFTEVLFLALNTFLGAVAMYVAFFVFDLDKFFGVLTIGFALCYIGMAYLVKKKFTNDTKIQALFYLTALTFVVLVVPMQFGEQWVSLGWLIEGVILAVYGVLNDDKFFKKCGYLISTLCLLAFFFIDVTDHWHGISELFLVKYTSMTLGSLALLLALLYRKQVTQLGEQAYAIVTIINTWIYGLYVSVVMADSFLYDFFRRDGWLVSNVIRILWTFAIIFLLLNVPKLRDLRGVLPLAVVLTTIGLLLPFVTTIYVMNHITVIHTLLLIAIIGLSLFVLYSVLKRCFSSGKVPSFLLPLFVCAYFLILLSYDLNIYARLDFSNMIYSILYAVIAIFWIGYGFKKHSAFMRRMGLVLVLLSVVKLFVLDFYQLTEGYRIISYFAMGIVLVAISYLYQKFDKLFALQHKESEKLDETN